MRIISFQHPVNMRCYCLPDKFVFENGEVRDKFENDVVVNVLHHSHCERRRQLTEFKSSPAELHCNSALTGGRSKLSFRLCSSYSTRMQLAISGLITIQVLSSLLGGKYGISIVGIAGVSQTSGNMPSGLKSGYLPSFMAKGIHHNW